MIGAPVNELNGGGALSYRAAKVAAIGETIERYSAAYMPDDLFFRSDAPGTADSAFRYDWNLFHSRQYEEEDFPFAPLTPDTPTLWTWARDIGTQQQLAVPADLVYLRPLKSTGATVAYATSNGVACSLTMPEALVSAILEAFERHAFMLTWHATLTPPLIDGPTLFRTSPFWHDHVEPTNLDVRLFALSELVGVPTVLAVVLNTATASAPISFGAASAPTISRAAEKATVEAFQTRVWIKAEQRSRNTIRFDSDWRKTIHSFDDHVRLYAGPNQDPLWKAISFLTDATEEEPHPERFDLPSGLGPSDSVKELVAIARRRDVELFNVDVTSPDVRDEGVVVVKVLSPQLMQLDASYVGRFLGNPALYSPLPWGHGSGGDFDTLNPIPHPFP
ncbi:YcaO-like family protein [Actinomyces sp. 2119]|uniref:YcaO-like family protein n=1 Tax=Actinomyces sp. 2119 TaxID=2321393 RepID=UPI00160461EF|nr:YcaO-like family protein [Actinomyces sp. 2119]